MLFPGLPHSLCFKEDSDHIPYLFRYFSLTTGGLLYYIDIRACSKTTFFTGPGEILIQIGEN
jgi:hypothetical protein